MAYSARILLAIGPESGVLRSFACGSNSKFQLSEDRYGPTPAGVSVPESQFESSPETRWGETSASDRLNSTKRRTQTITSTLDNYVHDQ